MTRSSLGLLVALLMGGLSPAALRAHHILGIPHYAYDEAYPELPFVEIMAQSGDWDLRMSYMPGIVRAGDRVRVKLYGKSRSTGRPLQIPLVGQLRKVRFGRREPVAEAFPIEVGKGPEGNDYKFFLTLPETEDYEILIRFPFPGVEVEEIPFPIKVGETDDRYFFGAAVALLAGLVLFVRFKKARAGRLGRGPKVPAKASLP